MAMNYIGSISILDRGDAPAQAVIDRNARSLAQRMSDETKDELEKVMTRVHNIYNNMDTVEEVYMGGPSMEYLNDLAELEEILKDEIKKRQYQQQVTVFIVGYSDVCHQKLRLLQQVNEFFMENTKLIDQEDWFPTTPDMDLEEISNNVEDSLAHAHALTNRLGELNREMVDYVAALAEKKASSKGKKKIEKALNQAKEEVSGLSEKLLSLQKDLEDKEEKVQNLFKQLDTKTMEANKYKTAAELGKVKKDKHID
ncbi:centrosome-associated protein CEP250-like isoform X1 [Elysia marginata]|uniref:Centrosome-associated protein CEP250-like isoform X1 n=1 Tax=Elysia marginata TaxID=1093978 RepID=A0AAV4I0R6_9GAST|nr:centrosome-associated protein CEP250-like isoform X1 [Elysia marginata]